jgi:hypothetical protein
LQLLPVTRVFISIYLQILGEIAVKVGAPMLAKLLEARVRPRPASRYARQRPNNPGWASPEMVKGWIRAMADMGEDKFVGSGSTLPSGSADFKSKARDIQTNPQNPNYQKYWNGDVDVQAMVREYLKKSGG